ncbi:MAG: peptidase C1 [Melioribacteraceae bacterium]|nr:peptidase C1 [Melioribacteraceae bacterium]
MKKLLFITIIILLAVSQPTLLSQDKGVFKERKGGFIKEIMKEAKKFRSPEKTKKKSFKLDFSNYDVPKSVDEFETQWHNDPISQGLTGTCWAFSTTSYFESEIYRLHGKKVKLSEIWTAYWEYIEKARGFVRTRGKSLFAEGSEANAVTRIWRKYGVVPAEDFTGLLPDQKFHDHSKMFEEMNDFLKSIKKQNAWNEEFVVETIKSILHRYLGTPPAMVKADGMEMTARQYLVDVLKLNLDDYIDVLSYMQKPYWEEVEYEVPDNWWHNKDYHNVPLDVFMKTVKEVLRNGYTIVIGGDVSEPGYDSEAEAAVVPTFDIPGEYIDENARQFRFSNKTTTDDHGIHIVGIKKSDDKDWFLIKDSGSGSRDGNNKGYYFYHEDYVKLKIMDFMVHKSAVKDLLKKFGK